MAQETSIAGAGVTGPRFAIRSDPARVEGMGH
jgi:hypothetical protein